MFNHQEKWPDDVNEAYRYVTHAVVATAYGVDVGKDAGGMGNTATDLNK